MAFTEQQLEAIKYSGGNILVSASAGSGKTHTMIERLKRLIIEEGVSVKEVLAVTFTEAAAADMKEKLKKALSDAINNKIDFSIYKNVDPLIINKLSEQLKEVATADISTMHSFCGRLIRSYFFAVGVAPDFKILDDAEVLVLRGRCIEQVFKEFYDSGEEWFLTLVDRHAESRFDGAFKEMVLDAYKFCDAEAYPEELENLYKSTYSEGGYLRLLEFVKKRFNDAVKPLIESARFALSVFSNENLVKGCNFTTTLIADMESAVNETDVYKLKSLEEYKLNLTFEKKLTEFALEQKEVVKACREEFIKQLKKLLALVGDNADQDAIAFDDCKAHTQGFIKIIDRFREIYTEEKREENAFDFNDLEHFALKILSIDEYRLEISSRYKYIFIDEFQDTNGVQDKIVSLLERDNVFMVGDDKQSIYGFRGSSSKFFTEKLLSMQANGQKVVRLNDNFRSAKAVINMVNGIFNYAMTKETYGQSYADDAKLIFGGLFPDGAEGRAELHFLRLDGKKQEKKEKPRIYDVLAENPEVEENGTTVLSGMLANLIAKELKKTYYDAKDKEFKKVGYGDIAILMRSKKTKYVKDLVSGLIRNGVPVQADVSENVCDYPEIKMVINALKLVDCFRQDFPLACMLKSPIGGVSDEELLAIVRFYEDNNHNSYGGFYDAFTYYLNCGDNIKLKEKLTAFNDYFNKLRLVADFIGAHGVLNKLVADNKLEAFLFAEKLGVNKVDRLKRFISASVVNGKSYTVKDFLLRIERCPDAFGLAPFASENTVKVMTIHSSKGLEFPVVIVCGLECEFNDEDGQKEILFSRDYGFSVKRYDDIKRIKKETPLRSIVKDKKTEDLRKEELRLFYVATTRATYSLHLVFAGKEDNRKEDAALKANCYLDFIPAFIEATEHNKAAVELSSRAAETRKVYVIKPDESQVQKMQSDYAFNYPMQADTLLPLKGSVTSALKYQPEKDDFVPQVLFSEDKTDKEKGTIAHKILEHFDFCSNGDVYIQTQKMLDSDILTEQELSKVNLDRLNQALTSGAFDHIGKKTLLRERGFLVNIEANKILDTTSVEPVLLQGVIDLLVVDGDSAEIIDYKYSALKSSALKEKYKKQLDLYAYAVEKALKKKVDKKTLVNVYSGETVEID